VAIGAHEHFQRFIRNPNTSSSFAASLGLASSLVSASRSIDWSPVCGLVSQPETTGFRRRCRHANGVSALRPARPAPSRGFRAGPTGLPRRIRTEHSPAKPVGRYTPLALQREKPPRLLGVVPLSEPYPVQRDDLPGYSPGYERPSVRHRLYGQSSLCSMVPCVSPWPLHWLQVNE
jgi:hypothetical protein